MIKNLQNEDLTSIAVKLGNALAKDKAIHDYCRKHFLKNMTVIVGADISQLPTEEEAPYIFINDLAKQEGASVKAAKYEATFCVGARIKENDFTITENNVVVLDGSKQITELMALVQDALNRYKEGTRPPDDVEAMNLGRVGNSPDHWLGAISCIWNIDLPLSRKEEF